MSKIFSKIFVSLQNIGKAIMLPIAVLPAAALLLRLGAPDVFNVPFVNKAGEAIFANLPLIFAAGIAVGISKGEAGAAALSGVIGYLTLDAGVKAFDESVNMGVFAGVLAGFTAGILYNRFREVKLPEFLGFFGGSRLIPILACFSSIIYALFFGNVWGFFRAIIEGASEWILAEGALGVFVFGVLNRALLPIGMHHILDSILWFFVSEYITSDGTIATGDLNRFFAGDPTAGIFMAGFFPIMMFALPAVALAIYHTAYKENRAKIGGMLFSLALTSFLTGITEPIEYLFMFLAPVLYAIHAVLTGLSMAITYKLGILHGFGFSAGFIDYVLNYGLATKPILIIPLGLAFAALYYIIFRIVVLKYDLKTPGRLNAVIAEEDIIDKPHIVTENNKSSVTKNNNEYYETAANILYSLGGAGNVKDLTNCITRLRIEVKDENKVDAGAIKELEKVKGVIQQGAALQVVIGTEVENVAKEIANIRSK